MRLRKLHICKCLILEGNSNVNFISYLTKRIFCLCKQCLINKGFHNISYPIKFDQIKFLDMSKNVPKVKETKDPYKATLCTYIVDVLWCQPIKLIHVVSTSEFHEY